MNKMNKIQIKQIAYHLDQIRTILYNMSESELEHFNSIVTIPDIDDRLTESVIYLETEFEQLYPNDNINSV